MRQTTAPFFLPKRSQDLSYDHDGNLTGDEVWQYTYNAENQLVRAQSMLPGGLGFTRLRLDFKYDHLGRRVEKRIYDMDASTEGASRRYIYEAGT